MAMRNEAYPEWIVPWAFLGFALLSEVLSTVLIGDGIGAFLYVTFHFVVNPVLAVAVVVFVVRTLRRQRAWVAAASMVGAGLALGVAYIGLSGSPWLTQMLGLRFSR